jgi:hypothetical protein
MVSPSAAAAIAEQLRIYPRSFPQDSMQKYSARGRKEGKKRPETGLEIAAVRLLVQRKIFCCLADNAEPLKHIVECLQEHLHL